MKFYFPALFAGFLFANLAASPVRAAPTDWLNSEFQAPITVSLPSPAPSGIAENDQIWFDYYPAQQPATSKAPAVLLLHYLGSTGGPKLQEFARYLRREGIAVAQVTLPYHGRRRVEGERPVEHFVGDANKVEQAFTQSATDVSAVVTWLTEQPGVDANRIGAIGISLGALVVHLAMGKDERINAGVAALGGGNFANNHKGSLANRFAVKPRIRGYNAEDTAKLNRVDPLTYADRNRPRRVLMIQAARDLVLPPQFAQELWEALGKPPIQWLDANHPALTLAGDTFMKTTVAYLRIAWSDKPDNLDSLPRVRVPTIKTGFLVGLDQIVTPAIQYQFLSVGTRRHMSLLSANIGLGSRGPFVGVAATVNQFIDIGLGRRLSGDKIRPYASFHFVY